MSCIEGTAHYESDDHLLKSTQNEQDWLRAEQEEQQWLRAEQNVLISKKKGPTSFVLRLKLSA